MSRLRKTFQIFPVFIEALIAGVAICVFQPLKLISQRELHDAWATCKASEPAEAGFAIEVEIDTAIAVEVWPAVKVHSVRCVKRLPPELNRMILTDRESLLNAGIKDEETRSM